VAYVPNVRFVHLNNSIVEKGSNIDRHATLFDNSGTIPYNSIKNFLELFKDKDNKKQTPMIILETPSIQYRDELNWIYSTI
jgi:endonuclease IV